MEKMSRLRVFPQICLCFLIYSKIAIAVRNCDLKSLIDPPCREYEYCSPSNKCECLSDYVRINETYCEKKQTRNAAVTPNYSSLVDNQGGGSLVAGILIPIALIVVIVCAIYASRRYQLLYWLRNKFSRRNENYDEFMIGQDDDDPPLA